MGGAIIYLVIVAVWAVVLVPRWLRSHDARPVESSPVKGEADEAHGRVLPRRVRGEVAMDEVDSPAPTEAAPSPVADTGIPRRRRTRTYEPQARARRAALRRRLVFGALMLALAGGVTATVYGLVPWWAVGAPTLLVPLYVVHVRRLIVAEHGRRRRERSERDVRARPAAASADADLPQPTSVRTYRSSRVAPGMRLVDRETLFDQHAAEPWQPQPVPLPTYLTAPAAPRAYQPTVSVDRYDDETAVGEEAPVYDIRPAVGG